MLRPNAIVRTYMVVIFTILLYCILNSGFFSWLEIFIFNFSWVDILAFGATLHRICIVEEILVELILAFYPYSENINQAKITLYTLPCKVVDSSAEFKIRKYKYPCTWTHGQTLFKVVGHFQKHLALLLMYIAYYP